MRDWFWSSRFAPLTMIGLLVAGGGVIGYQIRPAHTPKQNNPPSLTESSRTLSASIESNDGKVSIRGYTDGSITFWRGDNTSANAGNPEREHSVRITALALSPDTRWLLSGDADGKVVLWNAINRTKVKVIYSPGFSGGAQGITFVKGGRWAVVMIQEGFSLANETRVVEIPSGLDLSLNESTLEQVGEYAGGIAEVRRKGKYPESVKISPTEIPLRDYHRRRLTEIK